MNKILMNALILISMVSISACGKEGPAENLGEKIDDKVNQIEDKVQNRGPLEKAGDRVDDAIEN